MNWLITFQNFLISLIEKTYYFHKTTIVLFIGLLIILIANFSPLELHLTIDQLINKDFQSSKDYFSLKKEFNLGKTATLIINPKTNLFYNHDTCALRKKTQSLLFVDSRFSNAASPLYIRHSVFEQDQEKNILNFPFLLKLDCELNENNVINFSIFNETPWRDFLISKDEKSIIHNFDTANTNESHFDDEVVPLLAKKLIAHFNSLENKFNLHWMGDTIYQYYFKIGLDFNNLLNILIFIIIGILFKYYFGTFISSIIFSLTVIVSSLILFSLMSLFHVPIDILNNCLILLLTVSSLGDFVFLSSYEITNNESWVLSFKKIITPSFFTSLTTFLGFTSLCTSDIAVIRRLGLWGGISGLIEWVTVMLILPPFLKVILKNKTWVVKNKTSNFKTADHFLSKIFNNSFSKISLLILLTIPYSLKNINVNDSPDKLFKDSNPFRKSLEYMSNNFNFKGDISLIFTHKELKESNINKLSQIKKHPIISMAENPYQSLDYFNKNIPKDYHPLIESSLKDTIQFKRLFSDDKARAVLYLKSIEMKKLEELRVYVKNTLCADQTCYLSGALIAYADFSQRVPSTLIESFSLSIFLVFIIILLLAVGTNNLKNVFSLLLSSIWGVAATLLIISIFNIEINFVTSVVISILVGMTGDNTIHYIMAGLNSDLNIGIKDRAYASIINTITMVSCSTIFLLYYFEPPKIFGMLLIFGLTSSLIGDYILLKGLIKR